MSGSAPGKLVATLTLPFESMRTIHEGISDVHLYKNEVTEVLRVGKRVSAFGQEEAIVFREATLLQRIEHPHIVPVYDVARVDLGKKNDPMIKVIEMIIPYYERGSICDALFMHGERFSMADSVRLVRETLVGLDYLHETQRLLHRDMKSANVLLDGAHARISDLGMAVPVDADGTAEAIPDCQVSTAPETQVSKRCDRRTDIYGIGLILHELLNGPFPYGEYTRDVMEKRLAKGRRAVLDNHLDQQVHIPRRLRQIVRKATSRTAVDRYANAREMLDALGQAPFIDWCRVDDTCWEGGVSTDDDTRYRVTATRMKRSGKWRLEGLKCKNRWQRFVVGQEVAEIAGPAASAFFDQIVTLATNR